MGLRSASPPSVVVPGNFSVATLPDPADYAEKMAWATDGIAGGCFMYSNGLAWVAQSSTPFLLALGPPNPRTLTFGTAAQATDPTKAALVTVNLSSQASISLLDSTQALQRAEVYIAATAAGVTGATGSRMAVPQNLQSGTLVVTLVINQTISQQVTLFLPIGWFFGVRQITGTNFTVASSFDQSIG